MAKESVPVARKERGMILVIDANAVIPNPELQGSAWDDIRTAINENVLTVVIPRIVAREITARVRANRLAQRPKSEGTHRAPQAVQDAMTAAREEVERWSARYDAEIYLGSAGAQIRDTPTVDHDELAQRAIERVPPFNKNGGGYRDTLHWYTLLELVVEHPEEDFVFLSADGSYQNDDGDLHDVLRTEAEISLTSGRVELCRTLKEFVPPRKYVGDEQTISLDDDQVHALVAGLFPSGKLHAPDLWNMLDLDEPVDADVTDPGEPGVVFAFTRQLVSGGQWYRVRLRVTARVVFDWINWADDDEGTREKLDITAWYTVDESGVHIDEDRIDVQAAPVYTPPRITVPIEDLTGAGKLARSLTSSVFADWKSRELSAALGTHLFGDLSSMRLARLGVPLSVSNLAAEMAGMRIIPKADLSSLAAGIVKQGFVPHTGFSALATQLARSGMSPPAYGLAAAQAAAFDRREQDLDEPDADAPKEDEERDIDNEPDGE